MFIIATTIISTIAIPTAQPGCPNNSDNWLPKATANAAAVPGKNNTDCIQPAKYPTFSPKTSSRYTIIPPVFGITTAISATVRPAHNVIKPPITHEIIPIPGAPPVAV